MIEARGWATAEVGISGVAALAATSDVSWPRLQ